MSDKEQPILLEKRNGIGYITFNRPEVLKDFGHQPDSGVING